MLPSPKPVPQAANIGTVFCAPIAEPGDVAVSVPVLMPPGSQKTSPESIMSQEMRSKRAIQTGYFLQRLTRLIGAASVFGLAVAATVLSGGMGVPLVAVAGVAMMIALGDSFCSLYNLIQVNKDREPLKTADDCIALAVKALMMSLDCSEVCSLNVGDVVSCLTRVIIGCALLVLPTAHLSEGAAHTLNIISTAITVTITFGGEGINMFISWVERNKANAKAAEAKALAEKTEAMTYGATEDGKLSEEIKEIVKQIVACYEREKLQPQSL